MSSTVTPGRPIGDGAQAAALGPTVPPSDGPGPVALAVAYVAAMPFLAGLPRGSFVPVLRPSEVLQLTITGMALALAGYGVLQGRRWRARPQPAEWWLAAIVVCSSIVPLLWLVARGRAVGTGELLSTMPFVKYGALVLLIRAVVRTRDGVHRVVVATVGAASVVSAIAIAQAIGVGPVIEILERFFVSSAEDVVDGGRGTTTIGSSIATGTYLNLTCALSMSMAWASGRHRWLVPAALCGVGALASGQAGTLIGMALILPLVARSHGRLGHLLRWSIPAGAAGALILSTVVAARIDDLDPGSGLPSSWLVRWSNLSDLYLPSLLDGGWLLGVSPDAIVAPPDVWRTHVYLESGYLWLLWVGGIPLLVAAVGFLVASWRAGDPSRISGDPAVQRVARPAIAMMALISLIDPHLTLRASADLFFVLIALGLVDRPLFRPVAPAQQRWRRLLGADLVIDPSHRLQLAEAEAETGRTGPGPDQPETTLALTVVVHGRPVASTRLALHRQGRVLRGALGPIRTGDPWARALLWREVALVARSLRLVELELEGTELPSGGPAEGPAEGLAVGRSVVNRAELRPAAALAQRLEAARTAAPGRVFRVVRREIVERSDRGRSGRGDLVRPGIRIETDRVIGPAKRTVDLTLGAAALVVTAPIWLVVAALVRHSDPGPVLFRQVRIGAGGLPFQMLKFRTMRLHNDDADHRAQNRREILDGARASKDAQDPRITPIGHVLRRLSLDELPQLLNVLRGEMSLVGPRPSLLWESELYPPSLRRRLVTSPGLTGLWQVSGRADLSMVEMLELDLGYVDGMGLALDLRCLARTARSVLAREGAR